MPLQFFDNLLKHGTAGLLACSSGMVTKPRSWVLLAGQRPGVCDALRHLPESGCFAKTQTRQTQRQRFDGKIMAWEKFPPSPATLILHLRCVQRAEAP